MTNIDPSSPWRRSVGDAEGAGAGSPAKPPASKSPERTAAERYEAFAEGGFCSIACEDALGPHFDFDLCVDNPIKHPVLFLKEPGDANEVDPADVRQDGLRDCFLLAPLAAIASTPEGQALIRRSIVEKKDATGQTQNYVVTLHERESHLFKPATFKDVEVTIDAKFARGHAIERSSGGMDEIWPLVIEKAYAKYSGGYNAISNGGLIKHAMEALTGRQATPIWFSPIQKLMGGFSVDNLRDDLTAGKVVVFATRKEITPLGSDTNAEDSRNPYHLAGDHCYALRGIEEHDGRVFVQLTNPWGSGDPKPIAFDDLAKWFESVTVGSVR